MSGRDPFESPSVGSTTHSPLALHVPWIQRPLYWVLVNFGCREFFPPSSPRLPHLLPPSTSDLLMNHFWKDCHKIFQYLDYLGEKNSISQFCKSKETVNHVKAKFFSFSLMEGKDKCSAASFWSWVIPHLRMALLSRRPDLILTVTSFPYSLCGSEWLVEHLLKDIFWPCSITHITACPLSWSTEDLCWPLECRPWSWSAYPLEALQSSFPSWELSKMRSTWMCFQIN